MLARIGQGRHAYQIGKTNLLHRQESSNRREKDRGQRRFQCTPILEARKDCQQKKKKTNGACLRLRGCLVIAQGYLPKKGVVVPELLFYDWKPPPLEECGGEEKFRTQEGRRNLATAYLKR